MCLYGIECPVSVLLPVEGYVGWKGVHAAEEAMEGRHGVGALAQLQGDKLATSNRGESRTTDQG